MSFADTPDLSTDLFEDDENLAARLLRYAVMGWRPVMGWTIMLCVLLLAWLPMQAANANDWIILGSYSNALAPLGPLGVLFVWGIMGWRRPRLWAQPLHQQKGSDTAARLRIFGLMVLILVVGLFCLTQALVGWIPGPIRLARELFFDGGVQLVAQMGSDLAIISTRLVRWWGGVVAGGATQDDLVFAAFAGLLAWLNGILTGFLARRGYSGFVCALSSLWLLMFTLLYGSVGRMFFVGGLLLTVLLHVLLDERKQRKEWDASGTSYGEGLILDRLLAVLAASFVIFGVASLVPNLSFERLADRYFQLYRPINEQVEGFGQRLFPDLQVTSRFRGSALSTGLPNSFLLGAGPELSQTEVMRFRTDEEYTFEPEILEEVPTMGHYIRGGTLANYDGLGWQNENVLERVPMEAEQPVPSLLLTEPLDVVDGQIDLPRGRRLLTQDIFLSFNSRGLYGAAEPLSFSIDNRLERRGVGDQASFWVDSSSTGSVGASSYTVISAVPSVNAAALAEEVGVWGAGGLSPDALSAGGVLTDSDDPLLNELARHLALPDTITDRTRTLAQELTADLQGPFLKATAIEEYLRGLEYDLTVSEPPADVIDVADYFIFDLQRGYCDYYATAFIVMARLAGLPARFATGFAVGSWNSAESMWIVTEAEAHSWPEVYFPSYGWIAFEPTAGRPALPRVGVGPESNAPVLPVVATPQTSVVSDEEAPLWNWQMMFWLLPLGLLLWGGYRLFVGWQRKRQDPWTFILRWGQRIGRPMGAGETVLEYGTELGDYVLERYQYNNQDTGRRIARGITSLSEQLTTVQYGTGEQQVAASREIDEQWGLLRSYVTQLSRFS